MGGILPGASSPRALRAIVAGGDTGIGAGLSCWQGWGTNQRRQLNLVMVSGRQEIPNLALGPMGGNQTQGQ